MLIFGFCIADSVSSVFGFEFPLVQVWFCWVLYLCLWALVCGVLAGPSDSDSWFAGNLGMFASCGVDIIRDFRVLGCLVGFELVVVCVICLGLLVCVFDLGLVDAFGFV